MVRGAPAKLVWVLAALVAGWLVLREDGASATGPAAQSEPAAAAAGHSADDAVQRAFDTRARDVWLDAGGVVERNLADDNDGSRHQRFVIRTDGGISLLISHNIDLAPRLDGLAVGDRVVARGEYVWNDKGGLLHWTHHDPAGRLAGGYLLWKERRYE